MAERWVIRGGCFTRAAQVAGGSDMTVLNEMRTCYREAGKLMEPAYRFYPTLMCAAADLAIAKHNGRKLAKGAREELRRVGELKRSHTDFWQDIAAADAMLLESAARPAAELGSPRRSSALRPRRVSWSRLMTRSSAL